MPDATAVATTTINALSAKRGFRLQRHVDALTTTSKHYAVDRTQKTAVATGITMGYVVHGCDVPGATDEEERIVLIMGFRQSKEWWAPTVDALLARWPSLNSMKNLKILTFDNRGLGDSDATWGRYTTSQMADDALALMDHIGWQRAHIVGTSMGGMISLELASRAPQRVQSLSLNSTTRGRFAAEDPDIGSAMRSFSRSPEVIVPSVMALLHSKDVMLKCMEGSDATVHDWMSKYYTELAAVVPHPSIQGLMGQLLGITTHFVSDDRLAVIAQSGFPITISGGTRDGLVPFKESTTLAERLTGDHVRFVVYEGGGHSLPLEFPDEFVDEVVANVERARQ